MMGHMTDKQPVLSTTPALAIRATKPGELLMLKAVIDATGLFPSEMLDSMAAPYFNGEAPDEFWLTAYKNEQPVALAYYAPERMTQGTWNLLLIAVHPNQQRQGVGAALMHYVEAVLEARGERILLVETSGLPAFAATRAFYHSIGYVEEARIREYYQVGDDKIVFRKALSRPSSG